MQGSRRWADEDSRWSCRALCYGPFMRVMGVAEESWSLDIIKTSNDQQVYICADDMTLSSFT